VKAHFPGFIEPALAAPIAKVPSGERWIHEIKFDGYRVQLHIANDTIKVLTRRGHDWTRRFRKIAGDAFPINCSSASTAKWWCQRQTDPRTSRSCKMNSRKSPIRS
jgi:bifunctional non-homologous end joining protein LigD